MNQNKISSKLLLINSGSGAPGMELVGEFFSKLSPIFGLSLTSKTSLQILLELHANVLGNPSPKTYGIVAEKIKSQPENIVVFLGGRGTVSLISEIINETGKAICFLPVTTENDVWGSDLSVGFNSALESTYKLVSTEGHDLLILEVAGRDSGILALEVGLALRAQSIVCPENPETVDRITDRYFPYRKKTDKPFIIVVNEGIKPGRSFDLADNLRKSKGINPTVSVISPLQKKFSPCATDTVLASKMVAKCCEYLQAGKSQFMVGFSNGKFSSIGINQVAKESKKSATGIIRLAQSL